jgi:N-acyl-D-aspartate/D-glutamate deacylase
MHDLVIRNARVVDGSGSPAFIADVAVDGGLVSGIGRGAGRARRVVDADGRLLTPGWVDIHTHYDGQATWDAELAPSSWHGVTTVVFGNCGVGFAPVRAGSEPFLINLMEGVEDIPGTVLAQGLDFRWESFPQYLDALAAAPRAVDVGAQVPHAALRFYVMGERGADHAAAPTPAEIETMGGLLEAALRAGALGFSTSRTVKHRAKDGRPVPSLSAGEAELLGLADAMRRAGRGVLQVNSDFGPGEFDALRAAAQRSGRPLSVLLLQTDHQPELWRETLADIHGARAAGLAVHGQVGSRAIGLVMGLETSAHPFSIRPAWREVADLPPAARYARLRDDAALRARLLRDPPARRDLLTQMMERALVKALSLPEPLDYEPPPSATLGAQAAATGREALELALDHMLSAGGKGLLLYPFENYAAGHYDAVREMLADEATVCGLGDGGAHVGLICDASSPTTLLTHWARDRRRGPGLALELLVKKQARDTALAYGLTDRGLIAPGLRADFNVIEFERLRVRLPEVHYDLPAGGKRVLQRADGYAHTFVAGVETFGDGEPTGARPGRLVRGEPAN